MRNVCIVAGARPNFIKVAPIIWAINRAKADGSDIDFKLVYTGAEDDPTLEPSLFVDLQIARPDVFLGVKSCSLNELTGMVMARFESYLMSNPTDIVIVVDDLASTMAVAIVTKKSGVCLAHLVAGTRSFDINMPKEINRLVIDGLSDLLFTAGAGASSVVTREGVELSHIYMVGNVLMDTLRVNHGRLKRPALLDEMGIVDGRYLVFTQNRKALWLDRGNLGAMINAIIAAAGQVPIVAPLRKDAREVVENLNLDGGCFRIVPPLPYLEFGYLLQHSIGIITDSGNVAEEATFDGVPCATLNSYTEHIETVNQGSNVLVGESPERLEQAVSNMVAGRWKTCSLPDRWDGRTAERIVRILMQQ